MPAPGSVAITDFYVLKAHVNYDRGGFSQGWYLPMQSIANAKTAASRVLSYRSFLFGKGMEIAAATLSKFTVFKDGYKPDSYNGVSARMTGEATVALIATVNDFEVGPMWRLETGLGRFANHTIRGVRDAWIANNKAAITSVTLLNQADTVALTGAVDTAATAQNLYDRYFSQVAWRTIHAQVIAVGGYVNGVRTMTGFARNWSAVEYRRLSSHDTGQRYGLGRGRQAAWA